MTRPASSLTPASYAHCWAGTRSSLLTCWLGVSQVGLVLIRTHPLGNNNQFHEITLNSKVSGLPWREHAVVRLWVPSRLRVGTLCLATPVPLRPFIGSPHPPRRG